MNYCGKMVVDNYNSAYSKEKNFVRQWFILYNKPISELAYYNTVSDANMFVNMVYENMEYDTPNKNVIMDYIQLHKK
jgi:hypothetical protein